MNHGNDTYSDIQDIFRRLEALETAARLPQVSTAAFGSRFAQYTSAIIELSDPGAESTTESDAVSLVVTPPQTGDIIILAGAWLQGGGTSTQTATASVEMLVGGVDQSGLHSSLPTVTEYTNPGRKLTSATRLNSLFGTEPVTLRLSYAKASGAYTAKFSYPWILAIPV